MNILLIILVVVVVGFCYFRGNKCPKVLKDNKEMLLGVLVGLVICSFMGVNLEGITSSPPPGLSHCLGVNNIILNPGVPDEAMLEASSSSQCISFFTGYVRDAQEYDDLPPIRDNNGVQILEPDGGFNTENFNISGDSPGIKKRLCESNQLKTSFYLPNKYYGTDLSTPYFNRPEDENKNLSQMCESFCSDDCKALIE